MYTTSRSLSITLWLLVASVGSLPLVDSPAQFVSSGGYGEQGQDKQGGVKKLTRFLWKGSALEITDDGFWMDHVSYKTEDGTFLEWCSTDFRTALRAKQQVERELKEGGNVLERIPITSQQGQVLGERVLVGHFSSPNSKSPSSYVVMWTNGPMFCMISCKSLPILLEFENRKTTEQSTTPVPRHNSIRG